MFRSFLISKTLGVVTEFIRGHPSSDNFSRLLESRLMAKKTRTQLTAAVELSSEISSTLNQYHMPSTCHLPSTPFLRPCCPSADALKTESDKGNET